MKSLTLAISLVLLFLVALMPLQTLAQKTPNTACPLSAMVDVAAPLSSTSTVTVTPTYSGTHATTWGYKILACTARNGSVCVNHTAASAEGTTTGASATLLADPSSTDYNTVTWTAITGETAGYDIYRTTAGTAPTSTGLIGSVGHGVALSFKDAALVGDASTAPTTNTSQLTTQIISAPLLSGQYIYINNLPVVNPGGNPSIYVCNVDVRVVQTTTAANFGLVYGKGTACVTGTTAMTPLWTGVASTLDVWGRHLNDNGAMVVPPGNAVCLKLSAAPTAGQAYISYGLR